LPLTIGSIANQTASVLVIDDGSDPPVSKSPNYTLVRHPENLGAIQGLNTALEHLPSGLVIRLDDDDELLPGGVQALVEAWEPGTFVYSAYVETCGDNQLLVTPRNPWEAIAGGVAIHTDDIRRAGGYASDDVGIFTEYDLYARLIKIGIKPVRLTTPTYVYHRRSESTTGNQEAVDESLQRIGLKWDSHIAESIRNY